MPRLERTSTEGGRGKGAKVRRVEVWEAVVRGAAIESVSVSPDGVESPRKTKRCPSEERAEADLVRMVLRQLRRGFAYVGPAAILEAADLRPASALLIDTYFSAGDERLLDEA